MAVRSGKENPASPRKAAREAELQAEAQRLRTLLQPVIEQHSLYLEDVEVRMAGMQRTVHVIVDLPENREGAIGLDTISAVSMELSAAMDNDPDDDGRPYSLEISSPGVSRPLTEPRHWRRNIGRLVEVQRLNGDDIVGRLLEVSAEGIRLRPQLIVKKGMKPRSGDPVALDFSKIRKGTVQVEFAHLEDEHNEDHGAAGPGDPGTAHPA